MFDSLSRQILGALRVPPEPEPPFGAPGTVRVFRAGQNYYRLRLWFWGFKQVLAAIFIIFWFVMLGLIGRQLLAHPPRINRPARGHTTGSPGQVPETVVVRTVGIGLGVLLVLKGLGVVAYLGQLPLTYALLRLDYEQRWYMVTDRSLRLRSGLWRVRELTMSFANLQQITVTQGPLQRLFGLADVRVQSAGGGADAKGHYGGNQQGSLLHTGLFHGVENAEEIRDLITERLRRFRESGLGDPEERSKLLPVTAGAAASPTVAAAQELLAEAKRLRAALSGNAGASR